MTWAIVHDPPLVVLDEPTHGLDPLERRAMLGRLVTLARDHGKTIFVSTHVLRDVQAICDAMVVLVAGRVRLAGRIADLTGDSGGAIRLTAAGPLDRLVAELAARGVAARINTDDAGRGPGAASVIVAAGGTERLPAVWAAAAAAGVEVEALEPATRPLEEVFLATLADAGADGRVARRLADAAP